MTRAFLAAFWGTAKADGNFANLGFSLSSLMSWETKSRRRAGHTVPNGVGGIGTGRALPPGVADSRDRIVAIADTVQDRLQGLRYLGDLDLLRAASTWQHPGDFYKRRLLGHRRAYLERHARTR